MKIVFVSDCGPFDVYIARHVLAHWPDFTVLRVVLSRGRPMSARWKALLRSPLRRCCRFAERLLYYRRHEGRLSRQISQHLFQAPVPPRLESCIDVPMETLNSPETRQLLEALAPDVLIVSSAPLLKPDIYSTARYAAINVHRGIAPAYRGQSTLFWAMYHQDYENVGVTIHHLDAGIDTGRVLAQGFLPLSPGETEASLLGHAAALAAELVLDFLSVAKARPLGRQLSGPGRTFRSGDRHIWHDARAWLRRTILQPSIPVRGARKVEFFAANSN